MKGYGSNIDDAPAQRPRWQTLIIDAVGDVIDFWGFKRNQGRVWALLYLRDQPLTARQLQESLELSKGAVSMITRDLEDWGVVQRLEPEDSSARQFAAQTEFMEMITTVLREREGRLVERVITDLDDAYRLASLDDDVDDTTLERIKRMQQLAGLMKQALDLFTKTARLDVSESRDIL